MNARPSTKHFNIAFELAFSADCADLENPTREEILRGLRRRIAEVEAYPEVELVSALWPPWDVYSLTAEGEAKLERLTPEEKKALGLEFALWEEEA